LPRSGAIFGDRQERRDGAALIVRRDRRNALLQIGQLPRVEEPFKELGRAEMNDGKTRPVEHLFGASRPIRQMTYCSLSARSHYRKTGTLCDPEATVSAPDCRT